MMPLDAVADAGGRVSRPETLTAVTAQSAAPAVATKSVNDDGIDQKRIETPVVKLKSFDASRLARSPDNPLNDET